MFQTVVVGADDSETARQAVLCGADLAKLTGGILHIVTAYDPSSVHASALPAEFRYSATSHPADVLLQSLSNLVMERGVTPEVHPAAGGAVDSIVKVAEEVGADLIVVGNKGMHGARRVLGSVPNSVAHRAPCSVLIVDTEGAAGD